MRTRPYLLVSGTIFALVAFMHGLRLLNHWAVQINDWHPPMAASWLGLVIALALCVWAFSLVRRPRA